MADIMILPNPATLLRDLVSRAGLRPAITAIGADKDLDDMATDGRPSSTGDLMLSLEAQLTQLLKAECGEAFAEFCRQMWSMTRDALQLLAQNVDTSSIADFHGAALVQHEFNIPIFYAFFDHLAKVFPGPQQTVWWYSPFSAWVNWAAGRMEIAETALCDRIMTHFTVDQRSVERWQKGDPIEKLKFPYRAKLTEIITEMTKKPIESDLVDQISTWLIVAIFFQSLPSDLRSEVQLYVETGHLLSWTPEEAIYKLNISAALRGQGPIFEATVPVVLQITEALRAPELDQEKVQIALNEFESLIAGDIGLLKRGCQYTYLGFAAKFAARNRKKKEALKLYDDAVEGVWWYGGPSQKRIINEALLYAVGVGDKVAAERYWDKTFLLGLNKWPKRPLDDKEWRRLAMGFEQKFPGQKAEVRVPPRVEVILIKKLFTLTREQLKNPNRETKFAEGRVRRTPLIRAIQQGTLADVKRLLDAGGDPNGFIRESGRGPLSEAMYRARDRKDPEIMEYLLSLDLEAATVNRQFSTSRETPLKLAIEMASAKAVDKLIELGANFEADCELQPSALCYAVGLLYSSLHPNDRTQELAYYTGKGRADAYDAKDGAVLDADLAARRQAMAALRYESRQHAKTFESIREYFMPSANALREVIDVLLRRGANPNRGYHVEGDLWTPTLFAAQIGNLEVFQALVKAGGDHGRTLRPATTSECCNARWIALAYKRDAIVNWLVEKEEHH